MNKHKDALYQLIHCLNHENQNYITKFLKENKEHNHYLSLYDLIRNSKSYSDKKAMELLPIKKTVFPIVKHELYDKIISILLLKKNEKSVFFCIHDILNKIELLFNLGQFEQVYTLCIKVTELANKHDLPSYLLLANRWCMMAMPYVVKANLGMHMKKLQQENIEIINN